MVTQHGPDDRFVGGAELAGSGRWAEQQRGAAEHDRGPHEVEHDPHPQRRIHSRVGEQPEIPEQHVRDRGARLLAVGLGERHEQPRTQERDDDGAHQEGEQGLPPGSAGGARRELRSRPDRDAEQRHRHDEADRVERAALAVHERGDAVDGRQHDQPDDEDPPGGPQSPPQADRENRERRGVDEVGHDGDDEEGHGVVRAVEERAPRRHQRGDEDEGGERGRAGGHPVGPPVVAGPVAGRPRSCPRHVVRV